jgi:hypothetical protein
MTSLLRDGRVRGPRELRELLAMTAPPVEAGADLGSTTRLSPVRATQRQRSALGSAKVRDPEQDDLCGRALVFSHKFVPNSSAETDEVR